MEIKLIKTGTKDYEEMVHLRKKMLLDPFGISHSYINPEQERQHFLVGAFEDALIGCCLLSRIGDSTLQLRQMAVNIDFQGRGVGAAIVAFAEELAKKNGFTKLVLHARDTAKGFYSKCGYQVVGDEFYEVGLKHFLMEKEVVGMKDWK
ncbi:GNAT family N-acetyltransferase [Chitinophagaceae bacterium LB-8]|uniref:GNAT family N-acetyltransferase n=1 Tax=Paraflavisolibacter caeni TaxID=2982496 RepID=A0A9X3BFV0_9BACT|nr:GNAT family N-acetyltransferase [Paraflavisolibacter caeni]MCU7549714.1 GNAT family N-acetyltransferase [Paraflavisolibacter caeni]